MNPDISQKIEQFFSKYPLRAYDKGQVLIHAGDEPQHIFYLVSGKIRQYDISYRGDEVVVNVFKAGAFLPMLWAMTDMPNRHFFSAETAVEARAAPKSEVIAFLKANPDVVYDLLTRVYVGLDGLLGRMVQLMSGSAKSRLMHEIIIECRRFGKSKKDGSCLIAIKETTLATHVGLSRETVSRELQKMVSGGLIEIGRAGIKIKNLATFEKKLIDAL